MKKIPFLFLHVALGLPVRWAFNRKLRKLHVLISTAPLPVLEQVEPQVLKALNQTKQVFAFLDEIKRKAGITAL